MSTLIKGLFSEKIPAVPLAGRLNTKKLENINSISKYIVSGTTIQDTILKSASTTPRETRDFSELGDSGNFEKGYSQKSATHYTPVLKQFISSGKEGQGESSCGKSKTSQQFYAIKTLHKGRFTLLEVPHGGKRFSLQDRLKGCVFLGSTSQIIKEI